MFQGMEYIYEVYKEKSFSKAAAALFLFLIEVPNLYS